MYSSIVTDIFFDLDHTLWDFEKNSALTFDKIWIENQIHIDLNDFLKVYVPINFEFWKKFREEKITKEELRYQRLRAAFDALNFSISDTEIHNLSEQYISNLTTNNHLLPNTIEILEYLKPKYNLHIITNGFQEVQERKIRNSKIEGYFTQVINSEMAGVKKPNPIIFQMALDKAKVIPKRALMIGDSLEADILGALAHGLYALHFNAHDEEKHEFCPMITNLNEIKGYL